MKKLLEIIKNYKNSPSIGYFLLDNQAIFLGIVAIISFLLRFSLAMQGKNAEILESLGKSLEFASIISASLIAILLYFKNNIEKQLVKRISQSSHTVVFGLGDFSSALLHSELESNSSKHYIIFEKNIQNEQIKYFSRAGMGIVQEDAFNKENLEKLNFNMMEYAIVSLGVDRLNIELATMIIDLYKERKIDTPIKLFVHVINQDLNTLFHQKFITPEADTKHKIDLQTFSIYEECAESFFKQNFIDGEDDTIINSDDDYSIVIAGNGELALNIIYKAVNLAHLPNENHLHIHLVDKKADIFKKQIIKRYRGIENVVSFHTYDIDDETLEYFQDQKLWFQKNLIHVVVCYDDEEHNLKLATQLYNKTYLSQAVDKTLKTRISFAVFNSYIISNKINADKENFKQFYSFGDITDICTQKLLLDDYDLISKLVHRGYADKYAPNALYDMNDSNITKEIYDKWFKRTNLSDKLSNKAQSKHIGMKLKALKLNYKPSPQNKKELLKINRKIFDSKICANRDFLGLSDKFLQKYSRELPKLWDKELRSKKPINLLYFPKNYNTIFEKLIRAEHNRWNAFHYLNGWSYNKEKNKAKKEHDCLIPLSEFNTDDIQLTVLYDIYSILYIPNYLANSGYEIVDYILEK